MTAYSLRVMVAFDVLLMAVMNGKRNETISSAAWSLEQDGKLAGRILRQVIDRLFWFDPGHCEAAWKNEQK
jgi:hypothetical protein